MIRDQYWITENSPDAAFVSQYRYLWTKPGGEMWLVNISPSAATDEKFLNAYALMLRKRKEARKNHVLVKTR